MGRIVPECRNVCMREIIFRHACKSPAFMTTNLLEIFGVLVQDQNNRERVKVGNIW